MSSRSHNVDPVYASCRPARAAQREVCSVKYPARSAPAWTAHANCTADGKASSGEVWLSGESWSDTVSACASGNEGPLRLLAVHAHPDDESSKGAATMAAYVADGVQ